MTEEKEEPQFVPASKRERFLYAFVTIAMPIISFAITFDDVLNPDWQDGKLSSYAGIMLGGTASRYFYPFLLYAMVAFGLLLISPKRFSKHLFIRLGIYTGVFLSLHYFLLTGIYTNGIGAAISVIGAPLLFFGTRFLYQKIGARKTLYLTAALFFAFVGLWALIDGFKEAFTPLGLIIVFAFATAPFVCLIISVLVSYRLFKAYEFSRNDGFALLAWTVPYIMVWRISILKTIEVYSSLPTQPPCYIATAAAKGHPRFVKSEPVLARDGQTVKINAQLRYLKFAEIALVVITPRFHQILRKIYDLAGKALAHGIVHPLLADMAYLLLKPFELGARIALKMLFSDLDILSERIYRG